MRDQCLIFFFSLDRGALFIETFFKRELIARYLPDILKGMAVTIEIAVVDCNKVKGRCNCRDAQLFRRHPRA